MAWNEIVDKRGRGTKVFQDSVDPAKHSLDSRAGTAWHYQSIPDSGVYDAEVDLTPERVLAGGHDGWRITQNGWHHFLGRPSGLADGFVGFGGRQGDRWFLFRLARAGYLHWPTRAWQDVGGAPTYDRANLSQQTNETTINTTGETIPVETIATWSDIWNTPGGGALDVSWRADGNRLKEEVTINNAARTWIAANRPPTTPADETYFGFVFRLGSAPDVNTIQMDLSYLPRWLKDGILQDCEDFDDDDGTAGITVQNALQEFLFFLPVSEAYIGEGPDRQSIKLRKRIYRDGADYYLLVGAKVSDLAGLPAGDLVFDPTIDEQIDANADDGQKHYVPGINVNACYFGHNGTGLLHSWQNWEIDIGNGPTIDVSYITWTVRNNDAGQMYTDIWGVDEDDPAPPANLGQWNNLVMTTASVVWDFTTEWVDALDTHNTPSLNTVIQELANSYDYTGGADLMLLVIADGAEGNIREPYDYFTSAANSAQLHIEYTAAGGSVDITVPVAALEITGYVPTVVSDTAITVPVAALELTGYVPVVATTAHVDIEIPVGALVITGYAPIVTVSGGVDIEIPVGALAITGYAPTVETPVNVTVPVGILEITGYAPVVTTTAHVDIEVPAGVLEITGYAPVVTTTAHVDIEIPVGVLEITGYAPTVTATAHIDIEIPTGAIEIEGFAPVVTASDHIDVEVPVGVLEIEGFAPTVTVSDNTNIEVPTGALEITGYVPIVTTSSGYLPLVELTLEERDFEFTLERRSMELTLLERSMELTLPRRSMEFSLPTRSLEWTLPDERV